MRHRHLSQRNRKKKVSDQRFGGTKAVGSAIISSELKFGKSIADALPSFVPGSAAWTNKQNEQLMAQSQEITDNLLKTIKQKKERDEDTTRLEAALQEHLKDTGKPPIDINEMNASVNKNSKANIWSRSRCCSRYSLRRIIWESRPKVATKWKTYLLQGKASGKVAAVLG